MLGIESPPVSKLCESAALAFRVESRLCDDTACRMVCDFAIAALFSGVSGGVCISPSRSEYVAQEDEPRTDDVGVDGLLTPSAPSLRVPGSFGSSDAGARRKFTTRCLRFRAPGARDRPLGRAPPVLYAWEEVA